jgi:biotin carboxyl carrier protein
MATMVNKFKLVLEGVPYEIERKGDLLLINGQEYPWKIDGKTVTVGGNPHTVELGDNSVVVDGITYPIQLAGLEEPKAAVAKASQTAPSEGAGAITAIMPGLIIKILKQEGDRVEAGETVLILEAMKMQNEVQAKHAGVVKQIAVKEGESVEMRQVLAVIE